MKARCIKADPLGHIEVGKVYDCEHKGWAVLVQGVGFGVSKDQFGEYFEIVEE